MDDPGDRDDERIAHEDLSELIDVPPVDEDEQDADDLLEVDQTELEELGLTLDDPHQPDDE